MWSLSSGIYGFVFFPPNWTSFKNALHPTIPDFEHIRGDRFYTATHNSFVYNLYPFNLKLGVVGDYGYIAIALFFAVKFFSRLGVSTVPTIIVGEVYSLK